MVSHAVLPPETRARYQVASMLLARGLSRNQICILPNAANLAATVAVSNLISIVPRRYAELVAPTYGLRILEPPFDFPSVTVFIGRNITFEDPAVVWLSEVVEAIFK